GRLLVDGPAAGRRVRRRGEAAGGRRLAEAAGQLSVLARRGALSGGAATGLSERQSVRAGPVPGRTTPRLTGGVPPGLRQTESGGGFIPSTPPGRSRKRIRASVKSIARKKRKKRIRRPGRPDGPSPGPMHG